MKGLGQEKKKKKRWKYRLIGFTKRYKYESLLKCFIKEKEGQSEVFFFC